MKQAAGAGVSRLHLLGPLNITLHYAFSEFLRRELSRAFVITCNHLMHRRENRSSDEHGNVKQIRVHVHSTDR